MGIPGEAQFSDPMSNHRVGAGAKIAVDGRFNTRVGGTC